MRAKSVAGLLTAEVEMNLSGVYQPGYPATGPSYASGGDPGTSDEIEDVEITGLFIERRDRDRYGLPGEYQRVDLLAKVSPEARAEVLRALTETLRHEAADALLEQGLDD